MTNRHAVALHSILAAMALAACQPKTVPANPPLHQAAAAAPPPAPPPTMATMVCRNSQTGASVECGTPNAVMVGVKEK
jgi:hypothetical protein